MFDTVLIANRGEIAVRIIRTLRRLGIRSVAVYSDGDLDARHVRDADAAIRIGPEAPSESYLRIDRVIDAALASGAGAVHPGYGFLSENADFAAAVVAAGLVFIGPPASAIDLMGDKIRAKTAVAAAGVPVVPGLARAGLTDADLAEAAEAIGYPVLLKPSAGGGGKGMRLVHRPEDLLAEAAAGRREAAGAFGDDALFIERFVTRPRHLEVQVLADGHGNVVTLGEHECSLQRRHQKIVEEAPSPLLTDVQRDAMAAQAVVTAQACGYVNAGTVEFIVAADRPDEFFFMEMNTRLQVEHPVTELVWGVDLVELQLRVAAGEPLPFASADLSPTGHAIEVRVYAEDPATGFLPSSGRVLALHEPSGIRVDSSLLPGTEVGSTYDPMLAKVVAHGPDRATALARLDRALADTLVLGVHTNLGFLRDLMRHPDVVAGRLDTGLVERELDGLGSTDVPEPVVAAAALSRLLSRPEALAAIDPWEVVGGWRVGEPAWTPWTAECEGAVVSAEVRRVGDAFEVRGSDGRGSSGAVATWRVEVDGEAIVLRSEGEQLRFSVARADGAIWVGHDGRAWELAEVERQRTGPEGAAGDVGSILSPMPGTVTAVLAEVGSVVDRLDPIVVVEAMKMEHTLTAPVSGRLATVAVAVGDKVARRQVLAVVEPADR